MIAAKKIASVFGDKGLNIASDLDLYAAIKKGFPKSALKTMVSHVYRKRADQSQFKKSIIPEATFKRRKSRLSPGESEKIERLARVIATSEYVWDDWEDSIHFLRTKHPLLENERPIEVARSEVGARIVENLLWSIFYGHHV